MDINEAIIKLKNKDEAGFEYIYANKIFSLCSYYFGS